MIDNIYDNNINTLPSGTTCRTVHMLGTFPNTAYQGDSITIFASVDTGLMGPSPDPNLYWDVIFILDNKDIMNVVRTHLIQYPESSYYRYEAMLVWDTTGISPGSHHINAKVGVGASPLCTSDVTLVVEIKELPVIPPTTPTESPANLMLSIVGALFIFGIGIVIGREVSKRSKP